jgi:hypothetical protein
LVKQRGDDIKQPVLLTARQPLHVVEDLLGAANRRCTLWLAVDIEDVVELDAEDPGKLGQDI